MNRKDNGRFDEGKGKTKYHHYADLAGILPHFTVDEEIGG